MASEMNLLIPHGDDWLSFKEPDSKQDGGVANTHDFSSFSVSLAGEDLLYTMVSYHGHF